MNMDPLEEHPVLLTTEPSLLPELGSFSTTLLPLNQKYSPGQDSESSPMTFALSVPGMCFTEVLKPKLLKLQKSFKTSILLMLQLNAKSRGIFWGICSSSAVVMYNFCSLPPFFSSLKYESTGTLFYE